MQLSIGDPRSWWIAILVGLVLLTLALVVAARLRWIQSRPFATCIALSVFAHILLVATAFLSRIFDEVPRPPGAAPLRITITQPVDPEQRPESAAQQPWQRLASENPAVPSPEEVPRQVVDLTPQVSRVPPELPELIEHEPPLPESPRTVESLPEAPPLAQVPVHVPEDVEISEGDGHSPTTGAPALLDVVATPLVPIPMDPRPPPLPADESAEVDETPVPQTQEVVERIPVPTDAVELDEAPEVEETSVEPRELASAEKDVPPKPDRVPADPLGVQPPLPSTAADSPGDSESWSSVGAGNLFPVAPAKDAASPANDGFSPAKDGASSHPLARNSSLPWRAKEDSGDPPNRRLDGSSLPRAYQLRMRGDRLQAARPRGANKRSEQAVKAALYWLAKNQAVDGHWDAHTHGAGRGQGVDPQSQAGAGREADTGITGLALLAFLGAGHTQIDGKHKQVVQAGLEYLLRQQAVDGNLAGRAGEYGRMYCHGMATLALSEAVAMTGDQRLLPFLRRAVEYTVRGQSPTTGGWRYWPGDRGDTSQMGWQLMCVTTAESGGVSTPITTRRGMQKFLSSVSYGRGGLAAYRPGEAPTRSMTAEALVCRLFLDSPPSPAAVDEAVGFIMQETPGQGSVNYYYWYYGTLALSLLDDEDWPIWNRDLQYQLLSRQRRDDPYTGSWDPDSRWGAYGGRVFTTALGTLCLEVYYRYLPHEPDGLARRRQSATGRR